MHTAILSTAYLPPIQYFAKLVQYNKVLIEGHETYPKQTYRNRCVVYTANGSLALVIPVVKPSGNRTFTRDVRVDNTVKWQREHWRALASAYNRSAYFELIADDFEPFYRKEWGFLIDLNHDLMNTIASILQVKLELDYTEEYCHEYPEGVSDYRSSIHPKPQHSSPDKEFIPPAYFQVFADRHGFIPNLSVFDMLCNCGPQSKELLRVCL